MSKLICFLLVFLLGCSGSGKETKLVGAEFRSLASCLQGISTNSKSSIGQTPTNKPTHVSGYLVNGNQFGCKMISSGTKGVYFEGWYYADVKRSSK